MITIIRRNIKPLSILYVKCQLSGGAVMRIVSSEPVLSSWTMGDTKLSVDISNLDTATSLGSRCQTQVSVEAGFGVGTLSHWANSVHLVACNQHTLKCTPSPCVPGRAQWTAASHSGLSCCKRYCMGGWALGSKTCHHKAGDHTRVTQGAQGRRH